MSMYMHVCMCICVCACFYIRVWALSDVVQLSLSCRFSVLPQHHRSPGPPMCMRAWVCVRVGVRVCVRVCVYICIHTYPHDTLFMLLRSLLITPIPLPAPRHTHIRGWEVRCRSAPRLPLPFLSPLPLRSLSLFRTHMQHTHFSCRTHIHTHSFGGDGSFIYTHNSHTLSPTIIHAHTHTQHAHTLVHTHTHTQLMAHMAQTSHTLCFTHIHAHTQHTRTLAHTDIHTLAHTNAVFRH